MVAKNRKNRKNRKIVHIEYDFDFNIPGPSTEYFRRAIMHRQNIMMAKKLLKEKNAEKGWWDLTAEITETIVSTNKIINEYTDKFSITA